SAGGGTLEVKVINASGLPVLSADVNIRNASTTPVINFTAQTDTTGTLTLYGAKASIENYQITASKAGYSLSSTTARTASNPNPTLVNQSVFVDQKTSITLSIDQVSTLNIHTIKQTVPHNFMINTDGGTENQVTPRMAIDSAGNMVVVWQDFRVGSNGKIWSQKYDAAGNKIWASDIVISPANNQILPDIACDGSDNIYYVWNDDSNGNQDIFLVKRDKDGNNLWSGAKDVNNQAGNKDQIKARVAIATSSDRIAIAWQDNRNSDADIFFKLFNANDRSDLLTPEVRISTTTIGDGTNQQNPQIAFDNDNFMYIVWTDGRSGNNDIYAQKYDSSGVKQWTNDILINSDGGTGAQIAPAIAAGTSSLFVVWQDDRNGNQDIYARRIGSDGVKLWSSDTMINTDGGNTNQTSPAIAINKTNNELYIVWTDERNSNQDIYAQKINGNDGAAIWSSDVRANINTGSSAQYSPSVTWNAVEGKPYASWQDDRNGNSDIYATDFDQYGSITNISGVNVHIVGTKQIGDNPVIYKYDKIHTSDANGLIALPNMEWDSYNLSLSGITTFTIQTTDPATPVPLAPNTTTNVTVILK
ncbi:hypothetical protein HGA64_02000, partial [Candidatus Falkowbacteria bacterium]|nr:hypothetical protein [Candidatus Falkowbacteria bacterium]